MNPVALVAVGIRYRGILEDALTRLRIAALWLPDSNLLDPRVCGHADMMIHHLGGEKLAVSADTYDSFINSPKFSEYMGLTWKIHNSGQALQNEYPHDILFNSLRIGSYLFAHIKHTDVRILEYCEQNSIKTVDVRQGYAKCSVCIVQDHAAITADSGIATVMRREGLDVLLIRAGFIDLPGFDHGLIGGASGKIAADRIAFTGRLDLHPDCREILRFLDKQNVQPVFLAERPCFDVGSIIPLTEFVNQIDDESATMNPNGNSRPRNTKEGLTNHLFCDTITPEQN